MVVFWVIAAVLIIGALLFVLPPLLGWGRKSGPTRGEITRVLHRQRLTELERDVDNDVLTRAHYERARLDLERDLLEESADGAVPRERTPRNRAPWTAWIVGISLPALAVGLYLQFSTGLGTLNGVSAEATLARAQDQPSIEEMTAAIEARLQERPEDRTGWIMLARANTLLARYNEATQAYARADRLARLNDARLLAAYAQALAFTNGQQFAGRPTHLLRRALELDADDTHALWLAGWAAFQREDFAQAVEFWERLGKVAPEDELKLFEDLPEQIAEARRLARQPTTSGTEAPGTAKPPAGLGPAVQKKPSGDRELKSVRPAIIRVAVQLAPQLAGRVSPSDTVFVYAQAVNGADMPLALVRSTAAELPLNVTLDDSLAMAPAFTLSSVDKVRVTARVSKSGNAAPQTGDLLGESGSAATRRKAHVSITIDKVVP